MVFALDFVSEGANIIIKRKDVWHKCFVVKTSNIMTDEKNQIFICCSLKLYGKDPLFDMNLYEHNFDVINHPNAWTMEDGHLVKLIKLTLMNDIVYKDFQFQLEYLEKTVVEFKNAHKNFVEMMQDHINHKVKDSNTNMLMSYIYAIIVVVVLVIYMLYSGCINNIQATNN